MLLVSAKLAYNNITAVYKSLSENVVHSINAQNTHFNQNHSLLIRTVALQQYTLQAELWCVYNMPEIHSYTRGAFSWLLRYEEQFCAVVIITYSAD